MLPPLWPWKVLTLPARGPRPTLKGEVRVTLRVMDDIFVPQFTTPGWRRFGEQPSSYPMQRSQLTPSRAVAAVSYQPALTVAPAPKLTVEAENQSVAAIPIDSADPVPVNPPALSVATSRQPAPAMTTPAVITAAAVTTLPAAETAEPSPRNAWAGNV